MTTVLPAGATRAPGARPPWAGGRAQLVRAVASATPATAAAALVALLPPAVRPPLPAWVAGIAVFVVLPCLVAGRRSRAVGTAGLAVSVGALVPLRLGVPPERIAVLGAAAAVALVAGVVVGRSRAARTEDPVALRLTALAAAVAALVLRGLTVLGPAPASGTLPWLGVQVGELTRVLVVVAAALVVGDPYLRPRTHRAVDRRWAGAVAVLVVANLAVLVAVGDLGPAVLVVVALGAVAVHVHGLRVRTLVVGVAASLLLVTLAWASSPVLRLRAGEVVSPGPQLRGALSAAWSGGWIGPGPGRSPLVEGVPAIGSDYAVAALAADLGVLVVVGLLLVLLALWTHLTCAAASGCGPRSTVATGLAVLLGAQAAWNALGAVGVLPLTGLNQPFLGVSGASLVSCGLALGLVVGLLDAPGRSFAPARGSAVLTAGARGGVRVVAVLLVAASALVVLGPREVGDAEQIRMPRGTLWTADGRVVAADAADGTRTSPSGGLYADLGYERRNHGHRGVGAVEADTLTCGGALGPGDVLASLLHPVCRPADVITTVDSRVQAALAAGLGSGPVAGEAVLLDARTGAVAGLSSTAATSPDAGSAARTVQGPPGSTMKIVTAAAALLDGVDLRAAPGTRFVGDDGSSLGNADGAACPATDAVTALAQSCNAVFAWAANRVGAGRLADVARTYFGADRAFRLDGLAAAGLETGLASSPPASSGALGRTGIGQESVRSGVLGVALATAVVANGGTTTPWPRVVAATCDGRETVTRPESAAVGPPLPRSVADTVRAGMRAAVDHGTARRLVVPAGRDVVAKTGTAQRAGGGTDSWLTAIIDGGTVLTVVLHRPGAPGAALDAASRILAALPVASPTTTVPGCRGGREEIP